eukprot:CAMPEP_0174269992 /NCGR_PEP_ID=MMETSP0439-20130205/42901_1 /TAXON_ID=0 /ORGANISM="Stereomyxa ramosa, Strain Chinc5" /LENGTH=274 /DNA_ID=CAMNT_0015359045 /DNA_START=31 /DNA_END=858 /DNA_ORIENTATION=-
MKLRRRVSKAGIQTLAKAAGLLLEEPDVGSVRCRVLQDMVAHFGPLWSDALSPSKLRKIYEWYDGYLYNGNYSKGLKELQTDIHFQFLPSLTQLIGFSDSIAETTTGCRITRAGVYKRALKPTDIWITFYSECLNLQTANGISIEEGDEGLGILMVMEHELLHPLLSLSKICTPEQESLHCQKFMMYAHCIGHTSHISYTRPNYLQNSISISNPNHKPTNNNTLCTGSENAKKRKLFGGNERVKARRTNSQSNPRARAKKQSLKSKKLTIGTNN